MVNRGTISLLIGLILIGVKLLTGVEIGDEVQNQIIEVVMTLITGGMVLYGLIKKILKR